MSSQLSQKIIEIVRNVTGKHEGKISLHEPTFQGNEWKYVKECIDTNWVSSAGKYVNLFEQMICEITGAKHAIATVNGTAALHASLLLAGVEAGDEVLMPALTFVATANAAAYCNAIPNFVDVSEKTLGVCPVKLENYLQQIAEVKDGFAVNKLTGRRLKALIVMHCFGHPAELDELKAVCDSYNIAMIEDAAEAIGSLYKGKHVGNHGLLSILSFNGNKTITTGGGGAIITNDEALAAKARHLTTTGKAPHDWEYFHDCVAYNYRMPNLNAALGCAQLEQLDGIIEGKRLMAKQYQEMFAEFPEIEFISEPRDCRSNYWLNAVFLRDSNKAFRDQLLSELHQNGILARPAWQLMNRLPMFKDCPKDLLEISDKTIKTLVNLPSNT